MEVFVSVVRFRNAGLVNSGIYRLRLQLVLPTISQEQVAVVTYNENTPKYLFKGRPLPDKEASDSRFRGTIGGDVYTTPFTIDYEDEDVEHRESVLFHANTTASQLQSIAPCRLLVTLEIQTKTGSYLPFDPQKIELANERFGLNEACVIFFNDPMHGCATLDLIVLSASLQCLLGDNQTATNSKPSLRDLLFPADNYNARFADESARIRVQRRLTNIFYPFKASLAMLESVSKGAGVSTMEESTQTSVAEKLDQVAKEIEGLNSIGLLCDKFDKDEREDAPKRVLLFNALTRNYQQDTMRIMTKLKVTWKDRARDVSGELFVREKLKKEQLLEAQDAILRTKDYRMVAEKLRTAPRFTDFDSSSRPLTGSRTFTDEAGRPVVFEQRFESKKEPSKSSLESKLPSAQGEGADEGLHAVILLHGFLGSKWDLRVFLLALAALDIPGIRCKVIESNQNASEWPIEDQAANVAGEIMTFAAGKNVTKMSFVAYSMGTVIARAALNQPCMRQYDSKLYTFVSIAGPHLGTLGSDSNLVGFGQWAFMKWRKVRSLEQLALEDSTLEKLAAECDIMAAFTQIALVSSADDTYVPAYSARMELPSGNKFPVVERMQRNLVEKVLFKVDRLSKVEMAFEFASKRTAKARVDAMLGRAAHVHILDSLPLSITLVLIFAEEWFS